ncbi:TnsD family transposase [Pseudomonas sp. MWU13-2105]|uniref:TnsD family transposase n=1 Tax=Pseudomonas sp. MWU13-2105 TaxID=2935074 RepID=UPI00200BAD95|nr:TnsD family transposase [Pseudomonas sp. MWU13-2105]
MAQPDAILRWYNDETFFSLCSRQHQFLGHLDTSSTLKWLFGSQHSYTTHDFPSNLSSLDSRMTDCWGDTASIILEHTILPLLIPFQSRDRIDNAVIAMKGASIGSIKYSLGLLTGRFGAEHPLKACTSCMSEDRITYGVPYWHLTHQYPGVVLCPIHGGLLKESIVNRQWSGRFKWVLPSNELLESNSLPALSGAARDALRLMSEAVLDLASYGKSRCFDPMVVNAVYKDALDQLGTSSEVRARVATSFAEYASFIQPYPPYTSLPTTQSKASAFIAQMSRKARGRCHPLKHLVMITWLFGRLNFFIDVYDRRSAAGLFIQTSNVDVVGGDQQPIADKPNGSVTRKPKKLKPALRAAVLESLKKGEAKDKICSTFNISISTVNRLLSSDPLVKSLRQENQLKENFDNYRAQWTGAIKANSQMSTNELRSTMPSIYAWLYRNDRDWLLERNSQLLCGRLGNYSCIDWEKRDIELQNLIISTMHHVYGAFDQLKITKTTLFSLVPSLSRLLEKRARYPKTRLFIKELLQHAKA